MVTIADINATIFRLPLKHELRWGKYHKMTELRHVLVKVVLSDGSMGYAEAPPRPTIYGETPNSVSAIIRNELLPRTNGLPVNNSQDLQLVQAKLNEIKNNQCAKSAVDIALCDALANHHNQNLLEYIGGKKTKIKVSYILGIGKQEDLIREVEDVYNQGVRVFKTKIGKDVEAETNLIRKIKNIYGDKIEIYADANECLSIGEAKKFLERLSKLGLIYCEEPLPIEFIKERSVLKSKQILPLIADDSAMSVPNLHRELELDTFDILNIKTARTGYTESKKMLAMAKKFKKGVMVGSQATATIGTVRSALFASLNGIDHPCELSFFLKLEADITDRDIKIREGYIHTEELVGIKLDEEKLRKFTVEA